MIYSRLPVLFLGTITSEKYGAANAAIASTILKNLHKAKNYGIQDIADMCNVSVSSISRFCTQIGLSGFAEFREILMNADLSLEQQSFHEEPDERYGEYEDNAAATNNIQITVDSTGRANDLYRRVEVRLGPDDSADALSWYAIQAFDDTKDSKAIDKLINTTAEYQF